MQAELNHSAIVPEAPRNGIAARRAHGLPSRRAPGRGAAAGRLPNRIVFLNRVSDLLFMLARVANRRAGAGEVSW
jgi:cob(I)alamin adenosyltransferase